MSSGRDGVIARRDDAESRPAGRKEVTRSTEVLTARHRYGGLPVPGRSWHAAALPAWFFTPTASALMTWRLD